MKLLPYLILSATLTASAANAQLIDDLYRPRFHFTPQQNWMNDPNGLVYYDGEYHLFFQYNPFGIHHGNMSWGHAVSHDLVRWERLPVAIPMEDGIEIYSGSAVVDWENTSGFGIGDEPPLVAIYTGAQPGLQDQRIAYSNDRGRTWTKYEGNPVIDIGSGDFRDPKVFWHAETSRWVMVITLPGDRLIRFYTSPDLKSWTHASDFGPAGAVGGAWECPDLFQLPVAGEAPLTKWVLTTSVNNGAPAGGTGGQYFIGEFDGTTFVADDPVTTPLPEGTLLADFEGASYGTWAATGDAFGDRPAEGAIGTQQPVLGFQGSGLVNTFANGDGSTGTLTSPEFEITESHINFLIGGGAHAGLTCINLLVQGEIVRSATGNEEERLNWKSWDVSEFSGESVVIEIVDQHTGGWGHINVDHILMTNRAIAPNPDPALWMDFGPDNYAAVSWSDIPEADGRRLWIGWMVNLNYAGSVPTSPWRGGLTVPRELSLKRVADGSLRLAQSPVEELHSVRAEHLSHPGGTLDELNTWLATQELPETFELVIELEAPPGGTAELILGNETEQTTVTWDRQSSQLTVDRTQSGNVEFHDSFARSYSAPILTSGNHLKLHLLRDSASLEIFAADGTATLTSLIFPEKNDRGLSFAGSAGVEVVSFDLWGMKSTLALLPPPDDELIAHWKFDETTPGIYSDSTGNGHQMVAADERPRPAVVPGPDGNAMEIRSAGEKDVTRLDVAAAESLMKDSFTLSYHFNPTANDNVKLPQIGWESPAGLAWGFEILGNRHLNFYVFDDNSANDVQSSVALPFEAYDFSNGSADNLDNDPTWHHAAASYDATTGTLTLYLDGVRSAKLDTGLQGRPRFGTPAQGGGLKTGVGLTIYDDLRIYEGALDAAEIQYLRLHPHTTTPEPTDEPSLEISRHGSSLFVSWPWGTGRSLWKTDNLKEGEWIRVPESENTNTYSSVISSLDDRLFFRLGEP